MIFAKSLTTNIFKIILFQFIMKQLKKPFIYNLNHITFLMNYATCLNKKKLIGKLNCKNFYAIEYVVVKKTISTYTYSQRHF